MEFTLTRVVLTICGLLLLAAVIPPVTGVFEDREDCELQGQSDNIADLFDSFYVSEVDTMTLCMNDILPSCDSTIVLDGNILTLKSGEREYRSTIRHGIVNKASFGSDDIVICKKTDEGIVLTLMNPDQ
ncbi:MAG: hypothetical protein WCR83_02130 [Candidatus Methanomethylophilaceae archaeon]